MNTSNTNNKLVTLAIPYYGFTTRPQGRPEHIYIKFIANPQTGEYTQTGLCVWDPKRLPLLPDWLSKQGISTLLCNDNPIDQEHAFSAAGISIISNKHADFPEMINDWKRQQATGDAVLAA